MPIPPSLRVLRPACTTRVSGARDIDIQRCIPITDSLLPSLQFRHLIDLEPEDLRSVAIRLERHGRRVHVFAKALRGHFGLFLTSSSVPIVRCRSAKIDWAALWWYKVWVYEEQEMREGRSEVGTIDGTVSRGFRRIDVLATAAVQLDRLFVWDVRQPYWKERLRLTEYAGAASEVGLLVLFKL